MRDHLNPAIAEVRYIDGVAEVAGSAFDFDALLKERGEGRWVEDAVLRWLGRVDDVLLGDLLALLRSALQATAAGGRFLLLFLSTCSQAYCTMPKLPLKASAGGIARYVLVLQPF